MGVKPGYKQTEVGVIPEDWEIDNLGHFVKIRSGESPSKFMILDSGVPYFKVEQLNNSIKYQKQTPYFIDIVNPVKSKSLIFPKRGEAIYQNKIRILAQDSYMDTNLMTITVDPELDHEYLFYFLSKRGLSHIADTTSVPQINNKHIIPFKIVYPKSKLEQNAIATALSDADALIQSLERLIAKKRDIKQGAMQELLTGKKRLPGFEKKKGYKQTEVGMIPEDWGLVTLVAVADVRDGTHDSPRYVESGVPFVTSKNILAGQIDFTSITFISSKDAQEVDRRSKVDRGDILISMIGTVGNAALVDFEPNFSIKNVGLIKPYSDSIESRFVIQYLHSDKFKTYLENRLAGGIQKFVSLGMLRSLELPIPPTNIEQRAIATVLSDMDAEIAALDIKLTKARQIKQGMMQELLTGRIRLT